MNSGANSRPTAVGRQTNARDTTSTGGIRNNWGALFGLGGLAPSTDASSNPMHKRKEDKNHYRDSDDEYDIESRNSHSTTVSFKKSRDTTTSKVSQMNTFHKPNRYNSNVQAIGSGSRKTSRSSVGPSAGVGVRMSEFNGDEKYQGIICLNMY